MEPILSKQEIADLLRSIQDESAIVPGRSTGLVGNAQVDHRAFDLFEAEPAAEDWQPLDNFEFIVDSFGKSFSSLLSRSLKCNVSVGPTQLSSLAVEEHLLNNNSNSVTAIVELSPLMVPTIVSYDANLSSIILEHMMGGTGSQSIQPADRPRTRLELHMLGSPMSLVCEALDHAFKPIGEISSSLIRTINEAELISHIDPETEVSIYSSEIQVDSLSGHLELIFPAGAFEPFRDSLRRLNLLNGLGEKRRSRSIECGLDSMAVTVMAQAESIELSVRQLIDLQPGDIISLDHQPGAHLDILVEGVTKFSGNMLLKNRRRAVRINEIIA